MSETDGWVLLAECHDVAELHALRAALEVHGEHTHGIVGAIHGAMVSARVLVPAPALAIAAHNRRVQAAAGRAADKPAGES